MAPTCSNCRGTEFVWAHSVKTGHGTSGLSLRPGGEIPLGTRVCKSCGHADLFLHNLDILHQPHLWHPGEFVEIRSPPKPAEPAPVAAAPAPSATSPQPAPPAPAPSAMPTPAEPSGPPADESAAGGSGKARTSRRKTQRPPPSEDAAP